MGGRVEARKVGGGESSRRVERGGGEAWGGGGGEAYGTDGEAGGGWMSLPGLRMGWRMMVDRGLRVQPWHVPHPPVSHRNPCS